MDAASANSNNNADEGISEVMLPGTSLQLSAQQASALQGVGDCCSSSEGYATSQGSLTSETISPTSEADNTEEEPSSSCCCGDSGGGGGDGASLSAEEGPQLKLDSLTLALEELRNERHQQQPPPLQPLSVARPKPHGKRTQQQRSSSMKSQKTPPGTPNQMKKVVRFADAFGLDLAYVKHVFDTEAPPVIPPQATRDLKLVDQLTGAVDSRLRPGSNFPQPANPDRRLFISPCFAQPGCCANFLSRVIAQKVVLERASVSPGSGCEIQGVVRVANIGFEKTVSVRVTFDGWRNSTDATAQYVMNSSSAGTDQFAFTVPLPRDFGVGDRAVFCVRFSVCGETFWDNNFGDNYSFDCFAVNSNCGDAMGPSWTHFL